VYIKNEMMKKSKKKKMNDMKEVKCSEDIKNEYRGD